MGLYSFTIKWFVCPTKEFKRLGDFVTKLFSIAEAAAEAAVSFRIDEIALEAPAPDRLLRDFASNSSHLISEPVSASIDLSIYGNDPEKSESVYATFNRQDAF